MQLLVLLSLFPWSSFSQSCCSDLLITSSKEAADHQSHRLGSYHVTKTDTSGRPIYKHQEREQFLFHLQSRSKGLWMVGPDIGQFDGGLASPADPVCVEDVPSGGWRYTDGSAWYRDTQLRVRCQEEGDNSFTKTEINAKFKITSLKWDPSLRDPKSEKFQDLANTIENDITAMLKSDKELNDQADFTVSVKNFKKGSVVVDFKVNYVIKEAYIAIPFAIKPSNISKNLGDNFQFQKGILFQRFLIATDSFNSSTPADQCSAKGCSHKCDYDYDREEYVCTCPGDLTIHSDGLNCVTEQMEEDADYGGDFTTSKYDDDDTLTEFDLTLNNVDVLTTTEGNIQNDDGNIVNRIGITENITTSVTTENNVDTVKTTEISVSESVTEASTTSSLPTTEFDLALTNVDVLTATEGKTDLNDEENSVPEIGTTEDITGTVTTISNLDTSESTQTSESGFDSVSEVSTTISIPTTTDQAEKDEASTSEDISSIIPETSTFSIVPAENTEVAQETEERMTTSIRPDIITEIVELITTETSGLTFTEETTTQLYDDTEVRVTTEVEESLTTQSQDIQEIGVMEQTTKETLQETTDKIRTETTTLISINTEKITQPETTETSSTTKGEEIPPETTEDTTINPQTEVSNTAEQTSEESPESTTLDGSSTERKEEQANVNTEGTTSRFEDNTSLDTLEVISPESEEDKIQETKKETTETTEEENITKNSLEVTTTDNEDGIGNTTFTTKAEENATTDHEVETSTESMESIEKIAITQETITTEITTDPVTEIYEFDCDVNGETKGVEELPLECKIRNGEEGTEKKTVYIVIEKSRIKGDISRIFDDNVRLVVEDAVLEDISPK